MAMKRKPGATMRQIEERMKETMPAFRASMDQLKEQLRNIHIPDPPGIRFGERPMRETPFDPDFDTTVNPASEYARAAQRLAEQLRGGADPWANYRQRHRANPANTGPRPPMRPEVFAHPICFRCRRNLTVQEFDAPNGDRVFVVTCHGDRMEVRVPRDFDAAKPIGYGYAFQPGQTK